MDLEELVSRDGWSLPSYPGVELELEFEHRLRIVGIDAWVH
jgi:hypothetical protein